MLSEGEAGNRSVGPLPKLRKGYAARACGNPPYVAIERLQRRVREAACRVSALNKIGVTASGNCWYAFLVGSIRLLKPSGSLCFVLPAAWDFANYAEPLRSEISSHFEEVNVFRSETPLFEASGIQDGSVVLVARNLKSPSRTSDQTKLKRSEYKTAKGLITSLSAGKDTRHIALEPKIILTHPREVPISSPSIIGSSNSETLEENLSIGLGGVTGDASFFLLNEQQRLLRDLPVASMRAVLSRARHLMGPMISDAVWQKLKNDEERVWLFDPTPSMSKHPAVKRYIRWGKREGCDLASHKISVRPTWYRTVLPGPADGFISGMSSTGPWLCFRQKARLTATNTLYTVRFRKHKSLDERASVALAMLTSRSRDQLDKLGRNYAAGLVKYEPGDLRKLRIEACKNVRGSYQSYRRAIEALLTDRHDDARLIADGWFSEIQRHIRHNSTGLSMHAVCAKVSQFFMGLLILGRRRPWNRLLLGRTIQDKGETNDLVRQRFGLSFPMAHGRFFASGGNLLGKIGHGGNTQHYEELDV